LESFLEYIVDNQETVFGPENQPKWLKAHLIFTTRNWKDIFRVLQPEDYGDITHIIFLNTKDGTQATEFYAYEWAPGLIMMFTSSTKDEYEQTLKQFIVDNRGITESWIRPSIFEEMKNFLLSKHDAQIYRFISRRYRHWLTPAQIRPEYDRRINYSGEDAAQTMKEYRTLYGAIPISIDMRIYGSKIQINRNGLFIIRHITRKTLGVLQEMTDTIAAKQARLQDTSEKFHAKTKTLSVGEGEIKIPSIVAGKITLLRSKLSELMIKRMFRQIDVYEIGKSELENEEFEQVFSFIDTFVSKEEPLIFSATVVDEVKGTIFGISGTDDKVALIPKHRTTFESFVNFYNFVTENFDEAAELTTFNETLLA